MNPKWKQIFKVAALFVGTICVTELVIKLVDTSLENEDLNKFEKGAVCIGTILLSTYVTEQVISEFDKRIFQGEPGSLDSSVVSLFSNEQQIAKSL